MLIGQFRLHEERYQIAPWKQVKKVIFPAQEHTYDVILQAQEHTDDVIFPAPEHMDDVVFPAQEYEKKQQRIATKWMADDLIEYENRRRETKSKSKSRRKLQPVPIPAVPSWYAVCVKAHRVSDLRSITKSNLVTYIQDQLGYDVSKNQKVDELRNIIVERNRECSTVQLDDIENIEN